MASPDLSVEAEWTGDEYSGRITATLAGEEVGFLDFCDRPSHQGGRRVQIELVKANPERTGIGTALVAELRTAVPSSTLAPPMLNPAGRAFMDAIFDRFSQPIEQGP